MVDTYGWMCMHVVRLTFWRRGEEEDVSIYTCFSHLLLLQVVVAEVAAAVVGWSA